MAKLALNKSSLARESAQLAEFRRFLPSLELKRLQVMAERAKARDVIRELDATYERRFAEIGDSLPMLANDHIRLDGLVTIEKVERGEQNLSGTVLPTLGAVTLAETPYPRQANPHWVDPTVAGLKELVELHLQREVARERYDLLIKAEAVISRRVNLFEKVLIPQADRNIKKIRMALADAERDAVVRAKISKRKTAARAAEDRMAEL
ncbi:V-type ATP synthase subunit D [Roseibium sp.]|uniref:V-type ATP synthase subunit D n=1 Tax=Roseibium sp. TaxID=1936156 RepID=UPI003A97E5A1